MKQILIRILTTFFILCLLGASFWFYYNKDFTVFFVNNIETRKKANPPASKEIINIASLGHSLAYADFMWISMIQYIGNNIGNGDYEQHSINLLERISELSPKFHTSYEWILWMLPIPQNTNLSFTDEQKKDAEKPISIAKKGIQELCDVQKIYFIENIPLGQLNTYLQDQTYKNACKSGMLPYLIAFYGGQLGGDTKMAENYYKIAALHDDAPGASVILANIASQPKDNPKAIAENFFLMAVNGYDEDPFACQNFAFNSFDLLQKNTLNDQYIKEINTIEKNLKKYDDASPGMQTCQSLAERGTKYLYLHYFNELSKKYPNIENIEELLQKTSLETIPTTQSQQNMSLKKVNGSWEFYSL